ncbi:MAG TPA: hypothetical protein VGJ21_02255 [Terracidiphilus sp.]|jgi:hypothetical protein
MKRRIWIALAFAAGFAAAVWAVSEIDSQHQQTSSLMPDGALLYLEAKDFRGLLNDWSQSEEKRTWLKGDDYAAFSRSRLFERLSQAQDEFSTTANIPADDSLLSSIAGNQSALAVYDIGNLELVYVTRMDEHAVEATPLWQVRGKFEQRTEGTAQFYVRHDTQSNRTAGFAARDGWLVLGTREDLVAGVLDRIQAAHAHSISEEDWFADALKLPTSPAFDLRMVLNLEKIVPSPYFRSYWVQQNISEMKQYRAALCDLHRSKDLYREDRYLLRKTGAAATATGDVQTLAALAPTDAVWHAATASPGSGRVLAALRDNFLDLSPAQAHAMSAAPAAAPADNAGNAAMLEERIDVAPVIAQQRDPYRSLRALLDGAQPAAMLEIDTTRAEQNDMFVNLEPAMVIETQQTWDETAVKIAISSALRPGLTASDLGLEWTKNTSPSGDYSGLDGRVPLFLATREKRLFVSTDASLMEAMLARQQKAAQARTDGVTYASVFLHSPREQKNFRKLADRLDHAAHSTATNGQADASGGDGADGQAPPFFSGNVASLSRMFRNVAMESIEEKDQGAQILQTVVYQWQRVSTADKR